MQYPDFHRLEAQRRAGDRNAHSYAEFMHPNPRFYKYYWWVFHKDSPCDGKEFLTPRHRLNTAAAFELMRRLEEAGEPYWIYNVQLPRRDPENPFNPDAPRWRSAEWAPKYSEDPDPEYGGQGGHK